ncbi:hypothetical protein PV08_08289 [Exophiala spinifera]|uniref:UBC core domain-containing protein n=1 Tax=Exophiala spinifera TaxID=91928 RepID=A0A0D1ZJV9_9EURO|nr:uncharacterized protein PV08_08289 [Exophiala spinifera]KIW13102.1 hypothetical protein PV08_08289 [Exophiala spinifera]
MVSTSSLWPSNPTTKTSQAASFRRLAKDHAQLQAALPPNYLFLESDDPQSLPDDLTQLNVLVTGAEGTPYSQGLWLLHLRAPLDYPKSPPKATFKTRIYHPNIEESTGAVCLETLKRDWKSSLTFKDILVTISCLLIQPNPDSALNAAAGALIQENYDAFAAQAKLMASIHAPIPRHLAKAVLDAKRRGEEENEDGSTQTLKGTSSNSHAIVDQKLGDNTKENENQNSRDKKISTSSKRPLCEMSSTEGSETHGMQIDEVAQTGPNRKSPRLLRPGVPIPQDISSALSTQEDCIDEDGDKENIGVSTGKATKGAALHQATVPPTGATLRKVSNIGGTKKGLPRVGIRRL